MWQGSGEVVWGDTWHGMTQQQRAAPSLLRHHPRLHPPGSVVCRWVSGCWWCRRECGHVPTLKSASFSVASRCHPPHHLHQAADPPGGQEPATTSQSQQHEVWGYMSTSMCTQHIGVSRTLTCSYLNNAN